MKRSIKKSNALFKHKALGKNEKPNLPVADEI